MDVLIIDDEPAVCLNLTNLLRQEGFDTEFETTVAAAVERVGEAEVILLDLKIPGVEGLELLDKLLHDFPRTPVVMITAHGTIETAVEAMRRGAHDFIQKPPGREALVTTLERALGNAEERVEASDLYFDLPKEIILEDDSSRSLLEQIRRVSDTDLPVLFEGESGVGKDVFARLVHMWSGRSDGRLVRINCAAIPENLFESEFFGYEKGAFTGADSAKPGRVELADRGTLFLDEVGELSPHAQASLLQFLQDHTFDRVGGNRTRRSDIRLLTATNLNITKAVEEGSFREDLFYRIAGLRLCIPPLRERRSDIEALARYFLERTGRPLRLSPAAVQALLMHEWPGNVRELEMKVKLAAALSDGPEIMARDLFDDEPGAVDAGLDLIRGKRQYERVTIVRALDRTGGNRTEAARLLGISRRMLQKKLVAYEIK